MLLFSSRIIYFRSSITNHRRNGQSVFFIRNVNNKHSYIQKIETELKLMDDTAVLAVIACVFRFGYPPSVANGESFSCFYRRRQSYHFNNGPSFTVASLFLITCFFC